MGNGSVIRPGEIQRMSAGTGITHSEFNVSNDELVHFLQIWLLPTQRGIAPGYEQKVIDRSEQSGRLRLVASPDGKDGSVVIHADARVYGWLFENGTKAELAIPQGHHAWVHIARGKARINGSALSAGDGAAMSDEPSVKVEGVDASEVLVFDLA